MGGLMRAAHHHHQGYSNSSNNNNNGIISSRGRSYGLMLLVVVAFGAALLIGGIMFLQRIKERRIFNLLIKDRENQLTSLHLLLQVGWHDLIHGIPDVAFMRLVPGFPSRCKYCLPDLVLGFGFGIC